ncbi:MAG: polysaccharide deacetylase family protein [Candidatus Omnitrophica bacterium]|nr:polysaccharide deacetylase family protein [Candidatus Omnitrophota bacterium]
MLNAFSVDLEEWYHICGLENISGQIETKFKSRIADNTKKLLDILQSRNVKATFFVLGCIAQAFPGLIKEIDKCGHEIATHSFNHQQIYKQTKEEFSSDLAKSIKTLRQITGGEILGFRAPDFSITKKSLWALDILVNCGIRYDCSVFPIVHPRYGIPDAQRFPYKIKESLIEFPPSTVRFLGCNIPVAGGAYLRILPYKFIKWSIKYLNSKGIPVNIYIHPWELDPEQPRLDLPLQRRFMHYVNLKSTFRKIDQLLADFQFSTIKKVLKIA